MLTLAPCAVRRNGRQAYVRYEVPNAMLARPSQDLEGGAAVVAAEASVPSDDPPAYQGIDSGAAVAVDEDSLPLLQGPAP